MAIPKKDDFLIKREQKADEARAADDAQFAWFSPVGESEPKQRYRFLVVRQDDAAISIQPSTEARFKVGLDAWRWKDRDAASPETWIVVKTTASRVDLKRARD